MEDADKNTIMLNLESTGIKKKKKAVTLYLDGEKFDYVKSNFKDGRSISSFFNEILEQMEKIMKEKETIETKKEEGKSTMTTESQTQSVAEEKKGDDATKQI